MRQGTPASRIQHQEAEGAGNVDVETPCRIGDRIDDTRGGREMHDCVDVSQRATHQLPLADVSLEELHVVGGNGVSRAERLVVDYPE